MNPNNISPEEEFRRSFSVKSQRWPTHGGGSSESVTLGSLFNGLKDIDERLKVLEKNVMRNNNE